MKNINNLYLLSIIFLALIFMSVGCIEEETPVKAPETTTQLEETPIPTLKVISELNLKIGDTARTSKTLITIISAEKTKTYSYYSDIFQETNTEEASPGKNFILTDIQIENIGDDRVYCGASEFSVTDSEGYRYDAEIMYFGDDGLAFFQELYPNQKMKGKVLFKVPENANGLKIQYDFGNLFTDIKLASWELE